MADEETEAAKIVERGKFYFDNGATYEGEWKSVQDGEGGQPTENANEDRGRIMRHGRGKYVEGDYSYNGEWHEDHMHGCGEFRFASGNWYKGEFQMHLYHGHGTFTWADGSSYTGNWQNGKMHGDGSYKDTLSQKWDGQFYNGSGPGLRWNI